MPLTLTLNFKLIRYSPQEAASAVESPQCCITFERKQMEMKSFAPEEFFWVAKLVSTESYIYKNSALPD